MLSWSRPDPLTRDLVHLINARRHDHGDTDAAIDTLQAFLEQGREYDLLTVLAALDEDMAEWLFDLLAEASCSVLIDGPADEKLSYATMAALELPLQANLAHPLKLKIDPGATAELLHRHLRLSAVTVVRVESRLLTDSTLEPRSLQGLNEHGSTVADSQRSCAAPFWCVDLPGRVAYRMAGGHANESAASRGLHQVCHPYRRNP